MTQKQKTRIARWLIALLAVAVAAGAGGYAGYSYVNSSPGHRGLYSLEIRTGMSAGQIANQLEAEGLIRSSVFFRLLARVHGYDRHIHAGTHWIDGTKPTSGILRQLLTGGLHIVRVTIPEGLTIREIGARLARDLPFSAEEFVAAATDSALVARWTYPGAYTLEGYLFPDTYHLDVNASVNQTIGVLAGRFHAVFTPEWEKRADSLGMSVHEIVTLASIVEKEAQVARERGIVSQVFHKRLKLRYRLGADPTVKYAMEDPNRRLSLRDIEIDSPYNTYKHHGLPPGPICSPGRGALHATLYPADTDYLYFVANWDGTHTFTRSLREHNRAKQESHRRYWEMRREERRRAAEQSGG